MARKKTAVLVTDTVEVETAKGPKRSKPVPFDLPALLVAIDGKGSLWHKTGLKFDHENVAVVGFVLLLDDPAVSVHFQTYNDRISPKFAARIRDGLGAPVKDPASTIATLMQRGYSLVEPSVPDAPGRRRRRKAK
jgi:hypothetical protein